MRFNDVILKAINDEGKQDLLAVKLDLSPSTLSRKISGEVGWTEREINKLLDLTKTEIFYQDTVKAFADVLKVVLDKYDGKQ